MYKLEVKHEEVDMILACLEMIPKEALLDSEIYDTFKRLYKKVNQLHEVIKNGE